MRYVFLSKDDMRKDKEFFILVVLSLMGMFSNTILLYLCIDILYLNLGYLKQLLSIERMNIVAKVFATGVVMVFNFITRKIFLER
jgi:putative flippase GtrA